VHHPQHVRRGFATVPAYLRDLFGTMQVGAIHGRLLTAWSAAAIVGPSLVTYIREYQLAQGVAKADAYNVTLYIMAGLLAAGFVCNFLVRAVSERHHYQPAPEPRTERTTPEPETARVGQGARA